jgi:uncharacterized membrane protein
MTDSHAATPSVPDRGLVNYTHWIYGLHALSAFFGLMTAASVGGVAGEFIFGPPSIVAVIMNYARRRYTHGTYLESHFRWQIRTFWFTLLWFCICRVISVPFVVIVIGIYMWRLAAAIISIWVIYRITRGWLALRAGRTVGLVTMSTPTPIPPGAAP